MRRPSPVSRAAAAVSLVVWLSAVLAPAPGFAAEDETADDEAAAAQPAPAADDEAAAEQPAPAPVEQRWYDPVVHNANVTVDLLLIRPLAAVTLVAGAALFVPAAIMTAPNGWDSMKDAYQRFIDEPGEYCLTRPLGEF